MYLFKTFFVKALILNYINNKLAMEAVYCKIFTLKICSLSCCVFTRSFPDFHKLPRFSIACFIVFC